MDSSKKQKIDPATKELLERAALGNLSPEDETVLDKLLTENIELRQLFDEQMQSQHDTKSIQHLSEHSFSKSPSLERAMADLIAEGGRDPLEKVARQVDLSDPKIDSENIVLVRKLGQGGMGVVYEGFDRHLGRSVAIKFMASEFGHDETAKERLLSEAQAAAQIQHENVVAIHSIQLSGKFPYIVQQYVKGESLGERLERVGKLSAAELTALTMQLARGLSVAHRLGLVHRDLKPDNILIDDESQTARIADFGLAMRQGSQFSTEVKYIAGTPAYMSPEQTRGEPLDARSDLFSLGCLLYRAAAGKNPFEGKDAASVMERIRTGSPTPLDSIRNDMPTIWVDCVYRLLEKNPNDRLQSANSLIQSLAQVGEAKKSVSTRFAIPIALVVMGILTTIGLLLFDRNARDVGRFERTSDFKEMAEPVVDPRIWFEVVGDSKQHDTLEAAVAAVPTGGTILLHGVGVVNCGSVVLSGKSIAIKMDANAEVVLRPRALPSGVKEPFIRTDSPLELSNLRIESDRRGDFELPIQSTIESTNGPLQIHQCKISGRSSTACVFVASGDVEIRDSNLASPEGPVLVGPQSAANVVIRNCSLEGIACLSISSNGLDPLETASSYRIENSNLFGKCVLRMYLGRQPFIPIQFALVNSIDTCEYQVLISTFFPRRDDLSNSKEIVGAMKKTLHWAESHSVHQESFRPLGSVAVLPSSTVRSSDLGDWKEWADFWGLLPDESAFLALQVERKEFGLSVDRSKIPEFFKECGVTEGR